MPLFEQATIKAFFTGAQQMTLPKRSFDQLKEEGIHEPEDLKEVTKDGLESVFYNFHKPAKITVYTNPAARIGPSLREVEPFQVSAKSKMRLFVALDTAKYYEKTDRDLASSNMVWKVLKNFEVQHLAMKEKKDKTPPEAPNYQK